jgi:hypothetical protein
MQHEFDPDHPRDRARLLSPTRENLQLGLRARLLELRHSGISTNRLVQRARERRVARGLAPGIRAQETAGLSRGTVPLTLERLDQLADSGVIDLGELLAAGDGLPSRETLAMHITAILSAWRSGKRSSEMLLDALRVAEGIEAGALELVERRRARMLIEVELAEQGRAAKQAADDGRRGARKAVQP